MYNKKIDIDQDEIKEELNIFLKNKSDIKKYKLAEIEIMTLNEAENKKKVEEVINQIKLIGFENTAVKFSDSSSALDAGNLGWFNSKSLSKELSKVIKYMKIGDVTDPIFQPNSIVFFKLLDKKVEKLDDLNIDDIKVQIVNNKINNLLNLFSNNYISKLKNNAFIELK